MTVEAPRPSLRRVSEEDFRLFVQINKRGRHDGDATFRSLLIQRLRQAHKAVARLSIAKDIATAEPEDYSVHCEPCGIWFKEQDWADDWTCPQCGTDYQIETVIFSAVGR